MGGRQQGEPQPHVLRFVVRARILEQTLCGRRPSVERRRGAEQQDSTQRRDGTASPPCLETQGTEEVDTRQPTKTGVTLARAHLAESHELTLVEIVHRRADGGERRIVDACEVEANTLHLAGPVRDAFRSPIGFEGSPLEDTVACTDWPCARWGDVDVDDVLPIEVDDLGSDRQMGVGLIEDQPHEPVGVSDVTVTRLGARDTPVVFDPEDEVSPGAVGQADHSLHDGAITQGVPSGTLELHLERLALGDEVA